MSAHAPGEATGQPTGEAAGKGTGPGKALGVTFITALVCSLVVMGTHLLLKPVQQSWADVARYRNVLDVSGLLPDAPATDSELAALVRQLNVREVEITRTTDGKTQVVTESVFFVRTDGQLQRLILPVAGQGMWAPIRGYLALEPDLRTVAAISFHEMAETPGIGDKIQDPAWRALWRGKLAYDDAGIPVLGASMDPRYRIDAIAGATITVTAATKLVRDALGADGFGPFIEELRRESP
jgi:Na+-transporting NADH:ubiquinone oxidoreductase subunit C